MILVTGGTGLIGAHLLYKLISKGYEVRAIYRNESKLKKVKKVFSYYTDDPETLFKSINWVKADITDIPALEKVFTNINTVYHCAAKISFNPKDYKLSKNINIKGTANIVNLCLSNNVLKLCYVSSIATLGKQTNKAITEETHWNPESNKNNIYAITKYGAELEVWRGTQEGLNAVIVNPGVVIGPGFWNTGTGKIFSRVANGFNYYTSGTVAVIDVNDVAESMIKLTNNKTINNERYILVSESIPYKFLITEIQNVLNIKQTAKEASKTSLLLYYYLDKLKSFLFRSERTFFKANINSAFKTVKYDTSKIKKALNITFKSASKSIEETAILYKKDH